MKRLCTTFLLIGLFSSSVIAQEIPTEDLSPKGKWSLGQWDIGLGVVSDHYKEMSLDHLLSFAREPEAMRRDLSNFDAEYVTTTGGAALFGSVSLSPMNYNTGEYNTNQELQLGLTLYTPKEAMVMFKDEMADSSIVFCNLHGELAVGAAYIFKGQLGKRKRWHFYIGGGINTGFTFANEMVLMSGKYFPEGVHPSNQERMEPLVERFEAKSVYYSRFYIPHGFHYQFNQKFMLGLDFRSGAGIQKISGERANYIRKTNAFILAAKFRLN